MGHIKNTEVRISRGCMIGCFTLVAAVFIIGYGAISAMRALTHKPVPDKPAVEVGAEP